MRKTSTLIVVSLAVFTLPLFAQERSWTKKLKNRDKPTALQDRTLHVRGDSGRWSDEARLQHAPPIQHKPKNMRLDDWAERLLKTKVQTTAKDDNWLIFTTKQLDDNDRVWVERIERRGNQLTVTCHRAKWQGKYFRNFTYHQVIAVNFGKLEAGKYQAKWILQPAIFRNFDGDGRPRGNWPKDLRPLNRKPAELCVTFTVGN